MLSKRLETILKKLETITLEEIKELEHWCHHIKKPFKRPNILILSTVLIIGLSGCSTAPESDPAYVLPAQYSSYNCNQISAEMQRVSVKLEQMAEGQATGQVLNTALAAFAISQGYGFSGGDNTAYRRLYNQYEVLEQTAIQKECN